MKDFELSTKNTGRFQRGPILDLLGDIPLCEIFTQIKFWANFFRVLNRRSLGSTSIFVEGMNKFRSEKKGNFGFPEIPVGASQYVRIHIPISLKPSCMLANEDQDLLSDLSNLGFSKTHFDLDFYALVGTDLVIFDRDFEGTHIGLTSIVKIATQEKNTDRSRHIYLPLIKHSSENDVIIEMCSDVFKTYEIRTDFILKEDQLYYLQRECQDFGVENIVNIYGKTLAVHNRKISEKLEIGTIEVLKSHASLSKFTNPI